MWPTIAYHGEVFQNHFRKSKHSLQLTSRNMVCKQNDPSYPKFNNTGQYQHHIPYLSMELNQMFIISIEVNYIAIIILILLPSPLTTHTMRNRLSQSFGFSTLPCHSDCCSDPEIMFPCCARTHKKK